MILVIGGRSQGKTQYVRENFGVKEDEIACGFGKNRVIVHLEKLIREQGAERVIKSLDELYGTDRIVCCDEVGMGIVPADAGDRAYRDEVGRVLCRAAQKAERVIRVFAGIGQNIK